MDRLWTEGSGILSTQVLQEFAVNVRRKAKQPLSIEETRAIVADYSQWPVVINTSTSVLDALDLENRYKISFWDALIIQAAQAGGATTLYSEDLSDGQMYGSVRVVNPFADGSGE